MPGIAAVLVSCLLAVEPGAAPPETPADPGPHRSRIERIIAEGALGGVAGAAGFFLGGLMGGFSNTLGLYLALIGGPIGLTAGVAITGYVMDGNGSWLATLAGAGAGMLSAYVIVTTPSLFGGLAPGGTSQITTYLGALLVVGLPTLAAVIGYEVTSPDSRPRVEGEKQALRLFPVVGPSGAGRGVVLGLGLLY